jgi:transposase
LLNSDRSAKAGQYQYHPQERRQKTSQGRRSHKEAPRRGHKEKAGGYRRREAPLPYELRWQAFKRTHLEEAYEEDGLQPKKRTVGALERDEWQRAAWKVMVARSLDARALVFVDEMGTNTPLSPLYGWAKKGERASCSVPRNRGKNTTLLSSLSMEGMGPSLAVESATNREVFETIVEQILAPTLRKSQVMVMDNLTAHKGEQVRELIEGRGCELLYLPPYSPAYNPIEEAFSKVKGILRKAESRTRETLLEAIGAAISAVTAKDARSFFEHCGYRVAVQQL